MNVIKLCDSLVFNHGKCVVHGKKGLATLSPDNAIECVMHMRGCDVLNKRGLARPYVL